MSEICLYLPDTRRTVRPKWDHRRATLPPSSPSSSFPATNIYTSVIFRTQRCRNKTMCKLCYWNSEVEWHMKLWRRVVWWILSEVPFNLKMGATFSFKISVAFFHATRCRYCPYSQPCESLNLAKSGLNSLGQLFMWLKSLSSKDETARKLPRPALVYSSITMWWHKPARRGEVRGKQQRSE
jgi:hypothetical protein